MLRFFNIFATFQLICSVVAIHSGRDVPPPGGGAVIKRNMEANEETYYAAELRKLILSGYWLAGEPPRECGPVPLPLYKWYWDCFQEKHINLISSRPATPDDDDTKILLETPASCNATSILEDLFCSSGDSLKCLKGKSEWGPCNDCEMDDYTKQLYQQCSNVNGQPYETQTKEVVNKANPMACNIEDGNVEDETLLGARIRIYCKTAAGADCLSTKLNPFFDAFDKQQCESIPIIIKYKFVNVNPVEVIIENTTQIMVDNQSIFQRDGGSFNEESVFGITIPTAKNLVVSFDTFFDTCETNSVSLYADLHWKSTSIPTTLETCEIFAMTAVEYSNPLKECSNEAAPEGMTPNVDLWRCMYRDLKSEYRQPEGFDFFQEFIDNTGYELPTGCSLENGNDEYMRCASQSVRTILPDNVSSSMTLDVLRDNMSRYSDTLVGDICGGPIPNADEITVEYWACFLENLDSRVYRKLSESNVDDWSIFLAQLSLKCIESGGPYEVDCTEDSVFSDGSIWEVFQPEKSAGFCSCSNLSRDPAESSAYFFFRSFISDNPNQIPEKCLGDSGVDQITDCYVQDVLSSLVAPLGSPSTPPTVDPSKALYSFQPLLSESINESKGGSIAQIISSTVSFICSIAIICIILRSYLGLSTSFHRFLLALSISDVTSSFWMMLATLPAPTSYKSMIWNPRGNVHSCNTQGFFLYLGIIAAPLYNCSLCLYYLAVIKYNKKDEYIRAKLEPYLLSAPVIIALILGLAILSMKAFNPTPTHCWITIGKPYECEEEGICFEDEEAVKTLFKITAAGVFTILPCVIAVTMIIMYRAARENETKLSKYGVGSLRSIRNSVFQDTSDNAETDETHGIVGWLKKTLKRCSFTNATNAEGSNSNSAQRQSHLIFEKAAFYALAFFLAYFFPFVESIFFWAGREVPFGLKMADNIMFPLQGFFNFIVFIYPRVRTARKKTKGWFQSFCAALKSRGEQRNTPRNATPQCNLRNKNKSKKKETHSNNLEIKKLKKWPCMGVKEEEKCEMTNEMLAPLNSNALRFGSTYAMTESGSSDGNITSQSKGCLQVVCKGVERESLSTMGVGLSKPLASIKEDEEAGFDSQVIQESEDEHAGEASSLRTIDQVAEIVDYEEESGAMLYSGDHSVSSMSTTGDDQPLLITQKLASDHV